MTNLTSALSYLQTSFHVFNFRVDGEDIVLGFDDMAGLVKLCLQGWTQCKIMATTHEIKHDEIYLTTDGLIKGTPLRKVEERIPTLVPSLAGSYILIHIWFRISFVLVVFFNDV